jgi:hypothetical protein
MHDPTLGAIHPLSQDADLPTPEPAVYKLTNHKLHFWISVFTVGWWLPVWWLVHEGNKRANRTAEIRYAAALSQARHAAWQQRYGRGLP